MEPEEEHPGRKRVSRKQFIAGGAAAGAAIGFGATGAAFVAPRSSRAAEPPPRQDEEVVLYNGRIHTMDNDDRVVSGVVIRNGRFAEVDKESPATAAPST